MTILTLIFCKIQASKLLTQLKEEFVIHVKYMFDEITNLLTLLERKFKFVGHDNVSKLF